jgi:ubiquinone/menaquinone biosynthesis C-methylase UbiE
MDKQLEERERAEVMRSAEEARKLVVEAVDPVQVKRYLNPPADTAYPLEYAFYLLGDVRGKTVLDLGCGSGENLVALVQRGARVIGLDISPELIAIAQQRLDKAGLEATVRVGSAYETGLPDESVDVVFCIGLIHHLDIPRMLGEMLRFLKKSGRVVIREPIRFSATYGRLRKMLPAREDISDYEHPLTREELTTVCAPFKPEGQRYFRLPLIPLFRQISSRQRLLWRMDRWLIQHMPIINRYATLVVVHLVR